jgi:hypothetical protein
MHSDSFSCHKALDANKKASLDLFFMAMSGDHCTSSDCTSPQAGSIHPSGTKQQDTNNDVRQKCNSRECGSHLLSFLPFLQAMNLCHDGTSKESAGRRLSQSND